MAVRSFRVVMSTTAAVVSLGLALSFLDGKTSAFTAPIARASVLPKMDLSNKEASSPFRLGMVSKKTKTTIRGDNDDDDELSLGDDDDDDGDNTTAMMPINNAASSQLLSDEQQQQQQQQQNIGVLVAATSTTIVGLAVLSETANAISAITMPKELTQSFDPNSFVPVCAASDSFYRVLQSTAQAVVGRENFVEYGPLIASGLLRVRLELCVVESFFNEAVGPFISQNGLSWVLPVHETVETFLAGTVFALATTFILVGSTKLLTVIFTYADFFVGGPLRLFGGFFFDRARGKPVTVDIGLGPFKTRVIGPKDEDGDGNTKDKGKFDYSVDFGKTSPGELPVVFLSGGVKFTGQSIGLLRELLDAIDLFVGKSLILWVTAYVGVKFIHFKVFPDFP